MEHIITTEADPAESVEKQTNREIKQAIVDAVMESASPAEAVDNLAFALAYVFAMAVGTADDVKSTLDNFSLLVFGAYEKFKSLEPAKEAIPDGQQ